MMSVVSWCGATTTKVDEPNRGATSARELFRPDNLIAWCIVPFDSVRRGPEERVLMLKRLGFSQYVWDWRDEHLEQLLAEIAAAQKHGIRLRGVWIWIDGQRDEVGRLSAGNRRVIEAVKTAGLRMDFWLGFHENFFESREPRRRVTDAAAVVKYLLDEVASVEGTISLYNHGGWFGESENQVAILEAVANPRAGIVYNFHHAHHEIDELSENLARMLPYLRAVNINGMNPGGPKILPVGAGSAETEMLKQLAASGYRGPIGIIGHVEDADVEVVLRKNLQGLRKVVAELESGSK